jgi:hypothetical protein
MKNTVKILLSTTTAVLTFALIYLSVLNLAQAQTTLPIERNISGCIAAGCSGQLCIDRDSGGGYTTCEWKEEYACYRTAECTRQQDGKCGWTQTQELLACLGKAGDYPYIPEATPQPMLPITTLTPTPAGSTNKIGGNITTTTTVISPTTAPQVMGTKDVKSDTDVFDQFEGGVDLKADPRIMKDALKNVLGEGTGISDLPFVNVDLFDLENPIKDNSGTSSFDLFRLIWSRLLFFSMLRSVL